MRKGTGSGLRELTQPVERNGDAYAKLLLCDRDTQGHLPKIQPLTRSRMGLTAFLVMLIPALCGHPGQGCDGPPSKLPP